MKHISQGYIGLFIIIVIGLAIILSGASIHFKTGQGQQIAGELETDQSGITAKKSLQLDTLDVRRVPETGLVNCGYQEPTPGKRESNRNKIENRILYDFGPRSPQVASPGGTIRLWYNDEHAMFLGVRSGTLPISVMTKHPADTASPVNVGDLLAKDVEGRPIFPSIFLTDITGNASGTTGDWQNGGLPIPPHALYGTWKVGSRSSNDYEMDKNPAGNVGDNNWQLDGGTTPTIDTERAPKGNEKYGSLIEWNVNQLLADGKIASGKTYRVQFVVHDGDNTNLGGDVAEGCTAIRMP